MGIGQAGLGDDRAHAPPPPQLLSPAEFLAEHPTTSPPPATEPDVTGASEECRITSAHSYRPLERDG
jgi:hypothetical protein